MRRRYGFIDIIIRPLILSNATIDVISQYHLDPSIIIQTPIPDEALVEVLTYSMTWSVIILLLNNLLTQSSRPSLQSSATGILCGSLFIYVLFILCGFHPTYFPRQTLSAAIYVALNTICTIPTRYNSEDYTTIYQSSNVWMYLLAPSQNKIQSIHRATFYGSLIGMGVTSILRILDHGMQIQRHPVPLFLGATWGRVGGLLVGFLVDLFRKRLRG